MKIYILDHENAEEISKLTGHTLSELSAMDEAAGFSHEVVMFMVDEIQLRVPTLLGKIIKEQLVDREDAKEALHRQVVTDTRDAVMRAILPYPARRKCLQDQLSYYSRFMAEEDDLRWRPPVEPPVGSLFWDVASSNKKIFEREMYKPLFPKVKVDHSLLATFDEMSPVAEKFRTVMDKEFRRIRDREDALLAEKILSGEITDFAEGITRETAFGKAQHYLKKYYKETPKDVD